MTIYRQSKGKLVPIEPIEFTKGKAYYFGAYIPASIIYVTRVIGQDVYYVFLMDNSRYPAEHDYEHKESVIHLSGLVASGMENMRETLESYRDDPLHTLYVSRIQAILKGDSSGYDVPEYMTHEQISAQWKREAEERAKAPKSRYIRCAEVAKLVRAELKQAFPGQKFSVRSKTYSMGASIDVSWIDGPTTDEVEKITKQFEGATFDGMEDLKSYHDSTYNGELVRFESDYVFSRREYTPEFLTRIAQENVSRFGKTMDDLEIKLHDDNTAWLQSSHERVIGGNFTLAEEIYKIVRQTSAYHQPEATPEPQAEKQFNESGVTYDKYKGHAMIGLPLENGKTFNFGKAKAKAILAHIDEIKRFVDEN